MASRLNRGYVQTLERNLRGRALELDLSDVGDLTTRTTMLKTIVASRGRAPDIGQAGPMPADAEKSTSVNTAERRRSGDSGNHVASIARPRPRRSPCFARDEELTPALIPHVIPLLAWDPVADDAIRALQKVAPKHVGALADALLDPYEDFAVRRRIPRVMAVCSSQRAVDSLLLGLADMRFEVRFQCGRALAAIVGETARTCALTRPRIFDVVQKEVAVGRPVWEGRRLLDRLDDGEREHVRRRIHQEPRQPEPGPRVYRAVAGAAAPSRCRSPFAGSTQTTRIFAGLRSSISRASFRR